MIEESVYKSPSELMKTMTTIIDGGNTNGQILDIQLKKQYSEIKPFYDNASQENGKITGDLKKCQDKNMQMINNIINMNDTKMNYILDHICDGGVNVLAKYIKQLDDTYDKLKSVNQELIQINNNTRPINSTNLSPFNDIVNICNKAGFKIQL